MLWLQGTTVMHMDRQPLQLSVLLVTIAPWEQTLLLQQMAAQVTSKISLIFVRDATNCFAEEMSYGYSIGYSDISFYRKHLSRRPLLYPRVQQTRAMWKWNIYEPHWGLCLLCLPCWSLLCEQGQGWCLSPGLLLPRGHWGWSPAVPHRHIRKHHRTHQRNSVYTLYR